MADERTYIKVHDGIEDHPKIMVLSDKAFRVLVTTWGWSSRHTTDGFIPEAVWHKRASPKVRKELEPGLVHRPGHDCPRCPVVPDGHVRMHDYLEHQRSAEQIEEIKETKKRAGRFGNHKRWHVEQGISDPDCEFCAIPDGSQDRSHVRSQKRSQTGRKTSPETETETDKEDLLTSGGKPAVGRDTRKPTTEELAATAHTPAAHRLVEAYAKTCNRRPPRSVLTDLAHQVDALLLEEWPPDSIAAALTAWGAKGMHPKALPSVAHEVANKTRGTPGNGGYTSTTDANIVALLSNTTSQRLQLPEGGTPP